MILDVNRLIIYFMFFVLFNSSSRDILSMPFLTHILLVAAKSYQQRVSSAGTRESSHPRETSGASQRQSQLGSTTHVAGAGM